MVTASGVRIAWTDLPDRVRAAVAEVLGGPVVEARSQTGGFSPGSADRVRTAAGARAFVKAVSAAQNPMAPPTHRREIEVTRGLPPTASAPALLGSYDDGEWVALVLADVEGQQPATPWQGDEVAAVLAVLARLASGGVPTTIPDLKPLAVDMADDLRGWRHLSADPPAGLDPWAASRLEPLSDLAEQGLLALTADALVHADTRADNLLIDSAGRVTLVDWPWACLGPVWLDSLALLVNVNFYGGLDVEALLSANPLLAATPAADVTGFLAGLTGFFLNEARKPTPAGLPTLRAFQQAEGDATLSWLKRRLG